MDIEIDLCQRWSWWQLVAFCFVEVMIAYLGGVFDVVRYH
jgi:hypothetical protein